VVGKDERRKFRMRKKKETEVVVALPESLRAANSRASLHITGADEKTGGRGGGLREKKERGIWFEKYVSKKSGEATPLGCALININEDAAMYLGNSLSRRRGGGGT